MKQPSDCAPEQLECGCLRYCQTWIENAPRALDLRFSCQLSEGFGEAWFDMEGWGATEFSSIRIQERARSFDGEKESPGCAKRESARGS